jgi:hypothetical protein
MRFFTLIIVFLTGCSSIQVVQRSASGGVVALHGDEEAARDKAADFMRKECPFGYRIVSEDDTSVVDGDRELRIKYACKTPEQPAQATAREVAIKF